MDCKLVWIRQIEWLKFNSTRVVWFKFHLNFNVVKIYSCFILYVVMASRRFQIYRQGYLVIRDPVRYICLRPSFANSFYFICGMWHSYVHCNYDGNKIKRYAYFFLQSSNLPMALLWTRMDLTLSYHRVLFFKCVCSVEHLPF